MVERPHEAPCAPHVPIPRHTLIQQRQGLCVVPLGIHHPPEVALRHGARSFIPRFLGQRQRLLVQGRRPHVVPLLAHGIAHPVERIGYRAFVPLIAPDGQALRKQRDCAHIVALIARDRPDP
jgi:hypothetical protein